METNFNIETLDDPNTLPELSFDDLLDPLPEKKNGRHSSANDDDNLLETDSETRSPTKKDDTLNTPGSKKFQISIQRGRPAMPVSNNSISSKPSPIRATQVNAVNEEGSNTTKNTGNTGAFNQPPVLLNTKNVLPKTATQSKKPISSAEGNGSSAGAGGGGAGAGETSTVSLAGRTAVRTTSGQLIILRKSAPAPTTATKTSQGVTTFTVKSTGTKATSAAAGTGNKPVTIQFRRTAYGGFMPVSTNTTGMTNKTLLLSPSSTLGGKKLITSDSGQFVIKSTMSSAASTNSTVTSSVNTKTITSTSESATSKPKTFLFRSSGGKQIMVSNSNFVKISPQMQPRSTTAVIAGGPGKTGVQYVRVMPQGKLNVSGSLTSTSGSKTITTNSASSAVTTTASSPNPLQAPVKILNHIPQKFTVLQKGSATQLVVAKKKDPNATAPTKAQTALLAMQANKSANDIVAAQQLVDKHNLLRKHKLSELNAELRRLAASESDDNGPPEMKKPVPNNRVVLLTSNNSQKLLNNSLLKQGRVTTVRNSVAKQVQGTKLQPSSSTTVTGGQSRHLYTVLKPSTTPGGPQSVSTTGEIFRASNIATLQTSTVAGDSTKLPTNKQSLLQRHQKLIELKRLIKSKSPFTAASSASSLHTTTTTVTPASLFLPIKIKDEPVEFSRDSPTTDKITKYTGSAALELLTVPANPVIAEEENQMDMVGGAVRRKHCNCSKSLCLKLYCDCFANGEFCQDCTCKDCFNNLENEDERQKAIKACLERNPSAFKPKITSNSDQGDMRLHNKGCNCKRSGCLKNYCECYEAKIPCSSNCRCVGCRNFDEPADLDFDPVEKNANPSLPNSRTYSSVAIKTEKIATDVLKLEGAATTASPPNEKQQQCNFITQEVVDATIQCMITQADECEKNGVPAYQTEKMVMEELGRCLVEIIDFSIRNTDTSYAQD